MTLPLPQAELDPVKEIDRPVPRVPDSCGTKCDDTARCLGFLDGFRDVIHFIIVPNDGLLVLCQRDTHSDQTSIRGFGNPRIPEIGHRRAERHAVHLLQCGALRVGVAAHNFKIVNSHVQFPVSKSSTAITTYAGAAPRPSPTTSPRGTGKRKKATGARADSARIP